LMERDTLDAEEIASCFSGSLDVRAA
jgi:hypothetical protein